MIEVRVCTDLVEKLRRLDPGKEAEIDDSHLSCDLLGVKVKYTQDGRRGVWELKRPHPVRCHEYGASVP